jgi:hypothetical protein
MKHPFYKIPSPTPEDPFPQKDAESACATWVDAGGASNPFPQQTGTSNPFPQKDAESACATWVDAGGASDPLPQETGTSTPFPLTPTSLSLSLYKGVTDRAHS